MYEEVGVAGHQVVGVTAEGGRENLDILWVTHQKGNSCAWCRAFGSGKRSYQSRKLLGAEPEQLRQPRSSQYLGELVIVLIREE